MFKVNGRGSACGKFILLGEHFVLSGTPALAFPLQKIRCEVRVKEALQPAYRAVVPNANSLSEIHQMMERASHVALRELKESLGASLIPTLEIHSSSTFPVSRGFGSSASFAVALVRALQTAFGISSGTSSDFWKAVFAIESLFHSTPSGIDTAVVSVEEPIRFEKGQITRPILNKAVDFVLVDSGERESTSVFVERTRNFKNENPIIWEKLCKLISQSVDVVEKALKEADFVAVAVEINKVHEILNELGLSNQKIEDVRNLAKEHGALASKVSGAGCGGAVVVLAPAGKGEDLAGKLRVRGLTIVAVEEAER